MSEHITLDQNALMALASVLRKGSIKKSHTVKRIINYERTVLTGQYGEKIMKDETVKKHSYLGFKPVVEKYPEAYEVTLPQRSKDDKPNVVVLTPDEMAHYKLPLDGGLIDMETGEQLLAGSNVIHLPLSKSA